MRGCGIKVIVTFLDILPVVALRSCQAKETFLQDGILSIPESDAETEPALTIADSKEAVFSPSVGT
jgi:hypothetical protein